VLGNIGIRGKILNCLKAMYKCDSAALNTAEGDAEVFRCYLRVKQGCPLSPDMFGIFIDELERVLLDLPNSGAPTLPVRLPHQGVLTTQRLCLLLHVHDLVLLSTSREGLTNQSSALHSFCGERRLTMDVAKTKVMTFEKRWTDCPAVKYRQKAIEHVLNFKYLGLTFDAAKGAMYAPEELYAAGVNAYHALRR